MFSEFVARPGERGLHVDRVFYMFSVDDLLQRLGDLVFMFYERLCYERLNHTFYQRTIIFHSMSY